MDRCPDVATSPGVWRRRRRRRRARAGRRATHVAARDAAGLLAAHRRRCARRRQARLDAAAAAARGARPPARARPRTHPPRPRFVRPASERGGGRSSPLRARCLRLGRRRGRAAACFGARWSTTARTGCVARCTARAPPPRRLPTAPAPAPGKAACREDTAAAPRRRRSCAPRCATCPRRRRGAAWGAVRPAQRAWASRTAPSAPRSPRRHGTARRATRSSRKSAQRAGGGAPKDADADADRAGREGEEERRRRSRRSGCSKRRRRRTGARWRWRTYAGAPPRLTSRGCRCVRPASEREPRGGVARTRPTTCGAHAKPRRPTDPPPRRFQPRAAARPSATVSARRARRRGRGERDAARRAAAAPRLRARARVLRAASPRRRLRRARVRAAPRLRLGRHGAL